VLVHDMAGKDAHAVAEEIGGGARVVTGDIASEAGAAQLVAAVDAYGPLDILVNNYGTVGRGRWAETGEADWLDMYQRNVLSAARLNRAFAPAMAERGRGRIVQLGTMGSTRPNARNPHYYAAKGALANTTVSLAKELAGTGVTVNTVSPGLILTEEVQAHYAAYAERKDWPEAGDPDAIEARVCREVMPTLTGRMARPEEVAALVVFLCGDLAGAITAQNIRIDGGAVDIVS
jgi:NAD(P)-dependent dehydrogenase (short-subunit alcohol dehydrogenase family)